ncbi:MAG: SoxR reducing system RseC family protein [Shewanella sp.]
MIEELATVVEIEGKQAWVVCEKRSACAGCQQQSHCGTGVVANAFHTQAPRFLVALTESVRVGQQIRIGIPTQKLLRAASLVYLLPLSLLFIAALVGQLWLAPWLGGGEGTIIVSAVLGGVFGFVLARLIAKRLDEHCYGPKMLSAVMSVRIPS